MTDPITCVVQWRVGQVPQLRPDLAPPPFEIVPLPNLSPRSCPLTTLARRRIHRRAATPPGAPWRIRLTDEVRALFVDTAPDGWPAMLEATLAYNVSRQTIMHRVKTGELKAVHIRTGRGKGLRIQPPTTPEGLFQP